MQSPSSAVKPRVLSTLLPFRSAQRLAPLPRWATTTRPPAISGAIGQHRRDVLVRQAVEAVALHPGGTDLPGQGNELGDRGLASVEAGIEAGHLRHAGQAVDDGFDRRQVVRLVERSQGNQLPQPLQDPRRDHDGAIVLRPAVDDAVAHSEDAGFAVAGANPAGQGVESARAVAHRLFQVLIHEDPAPSVLGGEPGRRPDPLDLAPSFEAPGLGLRPSVDAELQARGAGVEDERVAARPPPLRRGLPHFRPCAT